MKGAVGLKDGFFFGLLVGPGGGNEFFFGLPRISLAFASVQLVESLTISPLAALFSFSEP